MRTRADKSAIIRINLRMAVVSRRGEGGRDVDGWALVAARRSPWLWHQSTPSTGGHKGPNPSQLLSRPYARSVAWPFSFFTSPSVDAYYTQRIGYTKE